MRAEVAVLGGGSWGTVLADVAAQCGPSVLWMRSEERARTLRETRTNPKYLGDAEISAQVEVTCDLEYAVRDRPVVLVVVPSSAMRQVARDIGEFLQGHQVVLSATKGLEPTTHLRMTQVLAEETCALKLGAISGPNLAKEIAQGQPAATVVASRFDEVIQASMARLRGPRLRLYGQRDLAGVEWAGALKNVIAIATGASRGLGFGDNTRASLVTRGMAEIQRLGVALGAEPLTFSGLAGIGDLIATCSSELSRNFRVGRWRAEGMELEAIYERLGEVAEGVNTTRVALELADEVGVEMPIARGVAALLDGAPAQDLLRGLMERESVYEADLASLK